MPNPTLDRETCTILHNYAHPTPYREAEFDPLNGPTLGAIVLENGQLRSVEFNNVRRVAYPRLDHLTTAEPVITVLGTNDDPHQFVDAGWAQNDAIHKLVEMQKLIPTKPQIHTSWTDKPWRLIGLSVGISSDLIRLNLLQNDLDSLASEDPSAYDRYWHQKGFCQKVCLSPQKPCMFLVKFDDDRSLIIKYAPIMRYSHSVHGPAEAIHLEVTEFQGSLKLYQHLVNRLSLEYNGWRELKVLWTTRTFDTDSQISG